MEAPKAQINIPEFHAKQKEVAAAAERFKVLNWGRRSGKSTFAFIHTYLEAVFKQGRYFIVTRNSVQARNIYWNDVVKLYLPSEGKDKAKGFHYQDQSLTVTFPYLEIPELGVKHDTSKPPSRIEFKSADEPDSLRGVGIDGVVIDEYAFMKNGIDMWNKILRPALADREGWAIFISTPDGIYNHFFDLVTRAQADKSGEWYYSNATMLDNTALPNRKTEWDKTKAEYELNGKKEEFEQEFEAKFSTPSELVYKTFTTKFHVIDPSEVPEVGTHIMGLDFGYNDPLAVCFILIDRDNNWYMYDEIYETEFNLQKTEALIRIKMAKNRFTRIIGDSAAKFDIASLKTMAFPIKGAKKGADSIKAGVRELNAKLEIREGSGKPKFFVTSNCTNTIKEFQTYRNMRDAYGDITDTPVDKYNHMMDAIRYLVLDHARHLDKRVKRKKSYDPITGRVRS